MASDLRGWETDPLFAAAEVVQDSADRMETIYRLVLHESGLIKGDRPDSTVMSSLKLRRRDLLTAFETTKWQLEDFEKEASLLIMQSKLQTRVALAARYRHFVEAIREQLRQIEKNLNCSSLRDSVVDTSYGNLNAQDEGSLESFLSGVTVNHEDQPRLKRNDTIDGSIFGEFLDAARASCSVGSSNGIVEENTEDTGNLNIDGVANCLRDASVINESICAQNGIWDLEASCSNTGILQRNKLKELIARMNIFFTLIGSYSPLYGSRISKGYTRKLKDEEQQHSPSRNILQHTKSHDDHGRKWTASALIKFQVLYSQLTTRITHSSNHRYACMNWCPLQSVMTMIFAAIFLGVMVLQVSQM